MIPISIEPPAFQKFLHSKNETLDGHSDIFVRLQARCTASLALASLRKIAQIGQREIAGHARRRGQRRRRSVRALPRGDRELSSDRHHPGPAGARVGARRGRGARAHARSPPCIVAAATSRSFEPWASRVDNCSPQSRGRRRSRAPSERSSASRSASSPVVGCGRSSRTTSTPCRVQPCRSSRSSSWP